MRRFDKQVIWVSGASSGIGAELASALVKDGAKVAISGRREDNLKELAGQLGHDNTLVLPLDVTEHAAIPSALQRVLAHYGHIDMLINNAGITQRSLAKDTAMHVYRKLMEVNYFGSVAMTQVVLPHMIEQKRGHIVATSSVVGKYGAPNRAGYSATKHALHGYFDSLRPEVKPFGIKVTVLVVGAIQTDISTEALTADGKPFGQIDLPSSAPAPKDIVEDIVAGLARGDRELAIGRGPEMDALELKRLDQEKFFDLVEQRAAEPLWAKN
jgi:dehydrogenase/reductase SDR family member 7